MREKLSFAFFVGLILMGLGFCVTPASAAIYTLTDANSTATFNLDNAGSNGLVGWTVDGMNQMKRMWFWYRIGNTGPEKPIETLGNMTVLPTDSNGDGNNDTLTVQYSSDAEKLKIALKFSLTGGETGCYDLLENSIKITNTKSTNQDVHFFQYTDMDMLATAGNDTVEIIDGRDTSQFESVYDSASTINPLLLLPTHYEVATDGDILARLTNSQPDNLNDQFGPLTGGDATWGFQWDKTVAGGKTATIGQNISMIPEPVTILMLATGGLMLIGRKK